MKLATWMAGLAAAGVALGCGGSGGNAEAADAEADVAVDAPVDAADADAREEAETPADVPPDEPDEEATPSACPVAGDLGPGGHTQLMTFDGVPRSYIAHVPDAYDPNTPTPVVFNLHGYTSAAWQEELFSGMNATADREGFIVVYPDGIGA